MALLGQYRKAELLRSLQITHSLLDRWQKRYGEAAAAAEGMLVELPDDSVPAKRDDSAERLALTLRGHGGVEVQGELTLDQWQQALRLVS